MNQQTGQQIRQRTHERAPQETHKQTIPMLDLYAEQFLADGPDSIKGRRGRLFIEICRPGRVTRKQLAADFAIRPGTVSRLVLDLIEAGLVEEKRPPASHQKGRPEILLQPVLDRLGVIVFFVVSQSIHATLVDLGGNELCRQVRNVQADNITTREVEEIILGMALQIQSRAPRRTEIVGLSFSLPGVVDETRNLWVIATSRWPRVNNLDISVLARQLGLRTIVNKHLNCELRARIARRGEPENTNILSIHWGHGIGSSFSMNGTTLVSGNGGFGEIGHVQVHCQPETRCMCGLANCLETQAALWALLPAIRARYPQVPEDEWQFEAFLKETEDFDMNLLDNAIGHMARAMRTLTLLLSPDQIVLTGPFVQRTDIFETLCRRFRDVLPSDSNVFSRQSVTVVAARAGTEDEIVGAAYPLFADAIARICN
ncbi:MAG TPA: ROK family transcriptional regulator [Devosia sp.]|nr:ROK family transcriptional regulator [Devosia sp.]